MTIHIEPWVLLSVICGAIGGVCAWLGMVFLFAWGSGNN